MNKLYVVLLLSVTAFFIFPANSSTLTSQDFFTDLDTVMVKVSPDGQRYALLKNAGEKASVIIQSTETQQILTVLPIKQYSLNEADINRFTWIDNQHLAIQFIEVRKGVTDLLDTKAIKKLIILAIPTKNDAETNVYEVKTNGWLVDPLIAEDNVFLYAKSSLYSKVYRIDIRQLALFGQPLNKLTKVDGGQFSKVNEVATVSGYATKWFIDPEGKVKAALHFTDSNVLSFSELSDAQEFTVVKSWDLSENSDDEKSKNKQGTEKNNNLFPIALSNEDKTYYGLMFDENKQKTLYKINFGLETQSEIFETTGYQILDLVLNEQNKLLGVRIMKNGKVAIEYIGSESKEKQQTSYEVDVVISESINHKVAVSYQENFNNPGEFYLKKENALPLLIGERFPKLINKLSSELIESSVDVDGLSIPYLLHLPSKKNKPVPLIVLPHGGPIDVHDNRYYNPITQLLVSAGYGVLQINFRGSSGYTEALKNAGKKHFGDLILNDIIQVTKTVIKLPVVNNERVCIFGMSYGGYAAISLGVEYPDLFKCAASWAGVTDLNLQLNSPQIYPKQQKWVKENIGDNEIDFDLFVQQSPVYSVAKLSIPLLVAHGSKDTVVDIEHAYRMKLMLEKHKKQYEWSILDEATHDFGSHESMISFFDTLLIFLQNNLLLAKTN